MEPFSCWSRSLDSVLASGAPLVSTEPGRLGRAVPNHLLADEFKDRTQSSRKELYPDEQKCDPPAFPRSRARAGSEAASVTQDSRGVPTIRWWRAMPYHRADRRLDLPAARPTTTHARTHPPRRMEAKKDGSGGEEDEEEKKSFRLDHGMMFETEKSRVVGVCIGICVSACV